MFLRTDGTYSIFSLERQASDGKWHEAAWDHFGHPPGFTASDLVWQRLGIFGVESLAEAGAAFRWMEARHPKEKWRVVRKVLVQLTDVVMFGGV